VHTHYATSGGLTGLVCNFHPTVVTVHGTDLTVGIKSRIWRPLLKAVFKHADCINTVSEDLKGMVLSLGASADRIEVFTLGIDTEKFYFVERPAISKGRTLKLVCTRHLWPQYDHYTIVEAVALLKKKEIDFQVTIVGDGPLLGELEQKVKHLGIVDNVKFMGRVDNNNLPEVLHKHDVYLSASLWDGTSLSLLEAMATGLFPIVSDIKANSSWIENGVNGFLHRVSEPVDLANCISELSDNPQLAVSAAKHNRRRIVESGDRRTNMRRLEGIYRSLISQHRAKC
jgi:glycosyltransferase involved in cell wall biosynthesis